MFFSLNDLKLLNHWQKCNPAPKIDTKICITKANLSKTVVPASRQNQRVSEGLSRLK